MKDYTREQLAPITKHLAQCQIFAQKDAVIRLYEITRSFSRDALATFLTELLDLYESPLFLKIYPDRQDAVWDKQTLETLLGFREKTLRERKAQQQARFFQDQALSKSAITSDIASRLSPRTPDPELASINDTFAVPDPLPPRSLKHPAEKSEARKILERQIVILDAFQDFPLLEATATGLKFLPPPRDPVNISASANATEDDRLRYFGTRFAYIQQKVLRMRSKDGKMKYTLSLHNARHGSELTGPKYLASVAGALAHINMKLVVLGMLCQRRNLFVIQDMTGSLQLDLSEAQPKGEVIFNEGAIVLLTGVVTDDGMQSEMKVTKMAHPPISVEEEGEQCWFGAEQAVARQLEEIGTLAYAKTSRINEHVADSIYIISQLNKQSMRDLNEIFDKMDKEGVPSIIVLIGEFNGSAAGQMVQSFIETKQFFDGLADILHDKRELRQHTQWVVMPGPDDFLPFSAMPNPHISKKLMTKLRKTLTNIKMASNPCRLSYYGKEVLISRGDFSKLLITSEVVDAGEFKTQAMVNTLLAQGTLFPFLKKSQLLLWNYAHALHVHSPPDVLVLADSHYHFEHTLKHGTSVVSPGSFGLHRTFAGLFFDADGKLEAELIDFKTAAVPPPSSP